MASQYSDHSSGYNKSFKNNRIKPQQSFYNTYSEISDAVRSAPSIKSTKRLIQPAEMYELKQPATDTIYPYNPNQSYDSQDKYTDVHSDGDLERNEKSTSCCWKPLCLGLTRFSGGMLFGTMIVVGLAAIGGLIASTVLYVLHPQSDSQWKVLGIIVCSVMLITILITLCVFCYCSKNGDITSDNNTASVATPEYNQENNFRKINNYNLSKSISPPPYGMMQNTPPLSINQDVIQVKDKQTNTEKTISPLRPRDFQRGVWPAMNAYGGLSSRPLEKPKMVNHSIQTISNETHQTMLQHQVDVINVASRKIIRIPDTHHQYDEEEDPNSFIEQNSQIGNVEKIIEKPKERSKEDDEEVVELARTGEEKIGKERKKKRHHNVSIKRIKASEKPNVV
ncbi:unnamed protein product [Rotaria sp. Silwood1]|nr:unnamed protein product [Rotaria sp. Silwood1]